MIKTVQRVVLNFPLICPKTVSLWPSHHHGSWIGNPTNSLYFFSGFFVFQGVEGSPGVPSIHPLDLTNKLHRKQPGTTTDQIVQPSVCLSFLSGSLSEFSIFSVMIFSTRYQKNEEEFGHNLSPNCLDEQLPKRYQKGQFFPPPPSNCPWRLFFFLKFTSWAFQTTPGHV